MKKEKVSPWGTILILSMLTLSITHCRGWSTIHENKHHPLIGKMVCFNEPMIYLSNFDARLSGEKISKKFSHALINEQLLDSITSSHLEGIESTIAQPEEFFIVKSAYTEKEHGLFAGTFSPEEMDYLVLSSARYKEIVFFGFNQDRFIIADDEKTCPANRD